MGELVATNGQRAIIKRFDALLDESVKVVTVADRAYKLKRTAEGLQKPEGMSDEEFNIACDAMLPQKDCPTYLRSHLTRLELAQRIAGGQGDGDRAPLITFIQNTFNMPKYDVIDVTPVEKKG